jgi:hypothetical protein
MDLDRAMWFIENACKTRVYREHKKLYPNDELLGHDYVVGSLFKVKSRSCTDHVCTINIRTFACTINEIREITK